MEADKNPGSPHAQSEVEHNYHDVHADTEMLGIQQSGPLNQRPFMNKQGENKGAEFANEFFSFFFLEC